MSKSKLFAIFLTVVLVGIAFAFLLDIQTSSVDAQDQAADKPPSVKITAPKDKSSYNWNTLVEYNIVVTDHGRSTKYQELPANEVLLKATYVLDLSHVTVASAQISKADPAGLLDIIASKCLGCHGFKSAAMGPSFSAIGKRYSDSKITRETLSKHIHDGSVGVWGQSPMPSHPELTESELNAMSSWIMEQAANPKIMYYVGTEGAFQMQSPGKPDSNAGLILTASYVSHDTKIHTRQTLRGEDTIIVAGK